MFKGVWGGLQEGVSGKEPGLTDLRCEMMTQCGCDVACQVYMMSNLLFDGSKQATELVNQLSTSTEYTQTSVHHHW